MRWILMFVVRSVVVVVLIVRWIAGRILPRRGIGAVWIELSALMGGRARGATGRGRVRGGSRVLQ